MQKLVSKNPIQRFKQGKKIVKALGGLPMVINSNGGVPAVINTVGGVPATRPATGSVGRVLGKVGRFGRFVKGSIPVLVGSIIGDKIGTYTWNKTYGHAYNQGIQQREQNKQRLRTYLDAASTSGAFGGPDLSNMDNIQEVRQSRVAAKPKQRSGWSYGYNRSNEISDIKATQQMLKDAGYLSSDKYDVVDGKWGSDTENAYKKYLLNKEKPVVAPTIQQISQTPLDNTIHKGFTQVMNTPPIIANLPTQPSRNGNFNKSQIRNLISQGGFDPYKYTGAQRKALRLYLNGESDDTSLLDGTDLARFTLPFRKQGGRLVSRNPIKRFKQGGISSFGKAFREARASGLKEFEWNGKKYHTRTKEEDTINKPKKIENSSPVRKQSPDINPDTLKYRQQKDDLYFGGLKDGQSNSSFKKALPKSYKAGYNDSKNK